MMVHQHVLSWKVSSSIWLIHSINPRKTLRPSVCMEETATYMHIHKAHQAHDFLRKEHNLTVRTPTKHALGLFMMTPKKRFCWNRTITD